MRFISKLTLSSAVAVVSVKAVNHPCSDNDRDWFMNSDWVTPVNDCVTNSNGVAFPMRCLEDTVNNVSYICKICIGDKLATECSSQCAVGGDLCKQCLEGVDYRACAAEYIPPPPQCDNVVFPGVSFQVQDNTFAIANLGSLWIEGAACALLFGNADDCKLNMSNSLGSVTSGGCQACYDNFNNVDRAADVAACLAQCEATGISSPECSDCTANLSSSFQTSCNIQDSPPPPPQCDGIQFSEMVFDSNNTSFVVASLKAIWAAGGICRQYANGEGILIEKCYIDFASAFEAKTSADCKTCFQEFRDVNHSSDFSTCIASCEASSGSDDCRTCAENLANELALTCNIKDIPIPPPPSCGGATLEGEIMWIVNGDDYTGNSVESVLSEMGQCLMAAMEDPFMCLEGFMLALPVSYAGDCSACMVNEVVVKSSDILQCYQDCTSESGCNGCDVALVDELKSTCDIKDVEPPVETTTAEVSGSGTVTMTLALIAGAITAANI